MRSDNKALYEKIMRNVARELKHTLNENYDLFTSHRLINKVRREKDVENFKEKDIDLWNDQIAHNGVINSKKGIIALDIDPGIPYPYFCSCLIRINDVKNLDRLLSDYWIVIQDGELNDELPKVFYDFINPNVLFDLLDNIKIKGRIGLFSYRSEKLGLIIDTINKQIEVKSPALRNKLINGQSDITRQDQVIIKKTMNFDDVDYLMAKKYEL